MSLSFCSARAWASSRVRDSSLGQLPSKREKWRLLSASRRYRRPQRPHSEARSMESNDSLSSSFSTNSVIYRSVVSCLPSFVQTLGVSQVQVGAEVSGRSGALAAWAIFCWRAFSKSALVS